MTTGSHSDLRSSKTQAAAQWLRDLAHRITLYDVDERRLREIATEFERLQRRVAELDALVKELSDELYAERELYARGL